jgi:hypothetical protein
LTCVFPAFILLPPSFHRNATAELTLYISNPVLHSSQIAFRVFDTNGDGKVRFDEFKQVLTEMLGTDSIPFTIDSSWTELYGLRAKSGDGHVLGFKCVSSLLRDARNLSRREELISFRLTASSPSS